MNGMNEATEEVRATHARTSPALVLGLTSGRTSCCVLGEFARDGGGPGPLPQARPPYVLYTRKNQQPEIQRCPATNTHPDARTELWKGAC
jgi:hypothetical protein